MKKTIAILITLVLSVVLIASCASAYVSEDPSYDSAMSLGVSGGGSSGSGSGSSGGYSYDSEAGYTSSGVVPITAPVVDEHLAEKIIYTVYADIEALNYDESIERVYQLLAANNAFIESSYVGGVNYSDRYRGVQTYRSANFSLRIPKERLNTVTAGLGDLGNVTMLRSNSENVTAQFTDTESRLVSLRVQEERLLDMLRRAEDVPDMLAIEERMTNVRHQIESITSTLRNWQNQVDYSTLHINIYEVETFTEVVTVQQRTYWQQIGDGFMRNLRGVGNFFAAIFRWLVVSFPVLLVLAVIAVAVFIIVRRQLKRSAARRKAYDRDYNYTSGSPYSTSAPPTYNRQQAPPNIPNPQYPPPPQSVSAPQVTQDVQQETKKEE